MCGEKFPKRKKDQTQSWCQILRMITIEIAISSTCGAQSFALHPAGMHCPAWDDAFGF